MISDIKTPPHTHTHRDHHISTHPFRHQYQNPMSWLNDRDYFVEWNVKHQFKKNMMHIGISKKIGGNLLTWNNHGYLISVNI